MDRHVKYWIDSADHDMDVAESLFQNAKYDAPAKSREMNNSEINNLHNSLFLLTSDV